MPQNPYLDAVRREQEESTNPYADTIRKEQRLQQNRQTAQFAAERTPDEFSDTLRAQEDYGVPPRVAEQDPKRTLHEMRVRDIEAQLRGSDRLQSFFGDNPAATTVAQDELGLFEKIGNLAGSLSRGVTAEALSGASAIAGTLGFDKSSETLQAGAAELRGENNFVSELKYVPSAAVAGGVESLYALFEGVSRTLQPFVPGAGFSADYYGRARQSVRQTAETLRGDQTNLSSTERGIISGIESTIQTTPLVLAAFLSGGGTVAAVAPGALIAAGKKYSDIIAEGGTNDEALLGAGFEGGLEGIFEAVPTGKFLELLAGNGGLRAFAVQQVHEQLGEQGATLTQDFMDWLRDNAAGNATINDYLAQRPGAAYETMIATLVGGIVQGAAFSTSRGESQNTPQRQMVDQAIENEKVLTELDSVMGSLKTRQRAPQVVREFSKQFTGTLTTNAQTLVDILDSRDVDLSELRKVMPTLDEQIDDALSMNGDVSVPTSEWLAGMAGQEFNQDIIPHLRTDPAAPSAEEARELTAEQESQASTAASQALREATDIARTQQERAQIEQTLVKQMIANNPALFSEEGTAETTAVIAGQAIQSLANRMNLSPKELFERYKFQVGEIQGAADLAQPAVQESRAIAETPEFENFFDRPEGRSVVVDEQGAPRVMVHATGANFEAFDTEGSLGAHFGTAEQAAARVDTTKAEGARSIPAYLYIRNPLRMGDLGGWDSSLSVVRGLLGKSPFSGESFVQGLEDVRPQLEALLDEIATARDKYGVQQFSPTERADIEKERGRGLSLEATPWTESPENKAFLERIKAILKGAGYDGIVYANAVEGSGDSYIAFDATQIKSAIGNTGKFDFTDPRIFAQDQRGRIKFGEDIATIDLTDADLTTFFHELAHYIFEAYTQITAQPGAPQGIADDVQTLLDWYGVKDIAAWQALGSEGRKKYHERFADAFELFIFTGKTPNLQLKSLFHRVRSWFREVYKTLKDFFKSKGEEFSIPGEVEQIMERMLIVRDYIDVAEQQRQMRPMFESRDMAGMTEEEWQEYQDLNLEATEDATDNLERRSLRDMKWLRNSRSRELKRLQKEVRKRRQEATEAAEKEVRNRPERIAEQFLKTGEVSIDGTNRKFDIHKLDTSALRNMYDALEAADTPVPDWRNLRSGNTSLRGADGLHPDIVASMVGMKSGDELVRALDLLIPIKTDIEATADQFLLNNYGDLYDPETLERAVDIALHNDARIRLAATELRALDNSTSTRSLTRAAKRFAEQVISRSKVGDLSVRKFDMAEARSARAAQKAVTEGDVVLAAMHKRAQILNALAARKAAQTLDEIRKRNVYMQKFRKKSVKGAIGLDTIAQIHDLMETFLLRDPRGAPLEQSLSDWLNEQKKTNLLVPDVADWILNAQQQSADELTVDQFNDVMDAIKSIEQVGRNRQVSMATKNKQRIGDLVDDAVTSIEDNLHPLRKPKADDIVVTKPGLAKRLWLSKRYFDSIPRQMDGWKDLGPVYQALGYGKNKAADAEGVLLKESYAKLKKLYDEHINSGPNVATRTGVPGIPVQMERQSRIVAALYAGTEESYQRLLDGGLSDKVPKLTPYQVQAIIDSLNESEMKFVQGIWDFNNSFWPQASAMEKRLFGYAPKRAVVRPVSHSKFGDFSGGYQRIVYNPLYSDFAETPDSDISDLVSTGRYVYATTERGYAKERADVVKGRPLRLELSTIQDSTNKLIHSLAWTEWAIDSHRILNHPKFAKSVRENYGKHVLDQLKSDRDIFIRGNIAASDAVNTAARYLRTGGAIANLSWSVWTGAVQFAGLPQALPRLGVWLPVGMMKYLGGRLKMERLATDIKERSPFMRERSDNFIRELNEIRNSLYSKWKTGRKLKNIKNFLVADVGFAQIRIAQEQVDVMIWLGAQAKAVHEGFSPEDAEHIADGVVRDTQGSGRISDRTAIENHVVGQFATLYWTFFSRTVNTMSEIAGRTRSVKDLPWAMTALGATAVAPAVMTQIMWAILRAKDPEDELELTDFGREVLAYNLNALPLVRELSGRVNGFDYRGPASVQFFANLDAFAAQSAQGEFDEGFWNSFWRLAGSGLHLPSTQAIRMYRGLIEYSETGENPEQILFGPKVESK